MITVRMRLGRQVISIRTFTAANTVLLGVTGDNFSLAVRGAVMLVCEQFEMV